MTPTATAMDTQHLQANLNGFAEWVKTYCKRTEKGDAQTFLNKFFECFGLGNVLEAGGTFEHAQKASSKGGNTGFLDCLFPKMAIIEMKQRGTRLDEHYNQLLTYWTRCVPKPRVGVLCNFDEFWIYDFNVQVDEPVQKLTLDELARHPEALLFMLGQEPDFERNFVDITEEAAEEIGTLYNALLSRRELYEATEEDIQRFVLQCVLCMYAEDIGLLPDNLFTDLLKTCLDNPSDSYQQLHNLFTQMNTKKPAVAGRFKDVRHFNGGLFNTITPIELHATELKTLYHLAHDYKWSEVKPSIFGTIFEKAIGHVQGSHFTSEVDIYKIVNPTIVRYWDERIEAAGTDIKKLRKCLTDLRAYKVLDPACGSGNFLYVAFQEMKRLEKQLMVRIKEVVATSPKSYKAEDAKGTDISLVSPMQFYGLEIKPFAVELARLTLEIGRKVAVNKFELHEDVLPLDNLNANILCADALFTPWPHADAIIGNPPFIGSRHFRAKGFSEEYVNKIHSLYPQSEFPRSADYCAYWFRKAHDEPAERIGLVGTNSISQGEGRKASLEYVVNNSGCIYDAISSQEWSGDANVYVSIVNWAKKEEKIKYLDDEIVKIIPPSLKIGFDATQAAQLPQNKGKSYQGVIPVGMGFIITPALAAEWIKKEPKSSEVLKRFSMGANLADYCDFLPDRWIIDFNDMTVEEASMYTLPYSHVKAFVKPQRDLVRRPTTRDKWWQYGEKRPALRKALSDLPFCFGVPRVSKWNIFIRFDHHLMLAGEKTIVVPSDDYYVFGLLNSKLHRDWIAGQQSSLGQTPAYTPTNCFETFPFLWGAPEALKQTVRDIMTALDAYRMNEMQQRQWGITKLYNAFFTEPASQLYKLHKQLDETVCKVYGWKYDPAKNYNEELFYLNQHLYQQEQTPLLAGTTPTKRPRKAKKAP